MSTNLQGELRGKRKKEKWRLFHAKDFPSLMYPCFTISRIFGIFSYRINASTFEISMPHYILSVVVTCVCSIYVLIRIFGSSLFGKLDMLILPENLADGCTFVFGGFIIVVTFILTGPRTRLLQSILTISERLPSEAYEELSELIHTKDIIGPLLLGLILIFSYTCRNKYEISILFHIYISLAVFQMDMLYMNCVCVLKMCFKKINNDLANMKRIILNNESHISRLNYHERNHFLIMELKALKKQHLVISDTVRMLNIIFSLQLLATVVLIFCNVTSTLYYYILYYLYLFFISTSMSVKFHMCFLSYLGYIFIKITSIVWACETGKNQALQISISIHDVFNITTDEQIKNEVLL